MGMKLFYCLVSVFLLGGCTTYYRVVNGFAGEGEGWRIVGRAIFLGVIEGDVEVVRFHKRYLQNPGRDKRGPPVSSQNRKESPFFGRTALVAAAIVKVLQIPYKIKTEEDGTRGCQATFHPRRVMLYESNGL